METTQRLEDSPSPSRFWTGVVIAGLALGAVLFAARGAIGQRWEAWRSGRRQALVATPSATPAPTAAPASPTPSATPLPSIAELQGGAGATEQDGLPASGPRETVLMLGGIAVLAGLAAWRKERAPAEK